MRHNFLVQSLANGVLSDDVHVIVEDNIGECIHVHFRMKSGFDFRLDFTVSEFKDFVDLVYKINKELSGG